MLGGQVSGLRLASIPSCARPRTKHTQRVHFAFATMENLLDCSLTRLTRSTAILLECTGRTGPKAGKPKGSDARHVQGVLGRLARCSLGDFCYRRHRVAWQCHHWRIKCLFRANLGRKLWVVMSIRVSTRSIRSLII